MWWEYLIAFVAGLIIGAIVYRYAVHKRQPKTREQANLEKELQNYQNEVHQHLMLTTELVQQIGFAHQRLEEHLRQGLHNLGQATVESGSVVPHFLFAHQHQKYINEQESGEPKTYVDSKNKE